MRRVYRRSELRSCRQHIESPPGNAPAPCNKAAAKRRECAGVFETMFLKVASAWQLHHERLPKSPKTQSTWALFSVRPPARRRGGQVKFAPSWPTAKLRTDWPRKRITRAHNSSRFTGYSTWGHEP